MPYFSFETNVLVIYVSIQIVFFINHYCKSRTEFSDLLEKDRIYWNSFGVLPWRSPSDKNTADCLIDCDIAITQRILLYLFIFERSAKHLTCKETMKSINIHHQRALRRLTRQNTELGLYCAEKILFWCRSKIKRTRTRTRHIYTCFVLCCCVRKYGMVWVTLMRNDKWLYHILFSHVRLNGVILHFFCWTRSRKKIKLRKFPVNL